MDVSVFGYLFADHLCRNAARLVDIAMEDMEDGVDLLLVEML